MRKSLTMLYFLLLASVTLAADRATSGTEHWQMQGDLTEACTCSVPCTCNFGQGPSPRHYCWALFSIDIQKGRYGCVKLDGLRLAGVHAKKSDVWYIDHPATPEQASSFKA